jgi:hypothetical protein
LHLESVLALEQKSFAMKTLPNRLEEEGKKHAHERAALAAIEALQNRVSSHLEGSLTMSGRNLYQSERIPDQRFLRREETMAANEAPQRHAWSLSFRLLPVQSSPFSHQRFFHREETMAANEAPQRHAWSLSFRLLPVQSSPFSHQRFFHREETTAANEAPQSQALLHPEGSSKAPPTEEISFQRFEENLKLPLPSHVPSFPSSNHRHLSSETVHQTFSGRKHQKLLGRKKFPLNDDASPARFSVTTSEFEQELNVEKSELDSQKEEEA